jgi:hypothetical protein
MDIRELQRNCTLDNYIQFIAKLKGHPTVTRYVALYKGNYLMCLRDKDGNRDGVFFRVTLDYIMTNYDLYEYREEI